MRRSRARDQKGVRLPLFQVTSDAHVRPLKTSESVARAIVQHISARGLNAGDRLPSESEMLEEYGVSRESLREALRLLEVQGLINLRRGTGGGPFVGHVDPASLGRTSTLFYHLAGATYGELCDAWRVVEPMLAERAALNDDRELVQVTMDPYLADGVHLVDPDPEEFVAIHTQFHALIAWLGGNRVLELLVPTIGHIISHHLVSKLDPRELASLVEDDHTVIAGAIAAGDAGTAKDHMAAHIDRLVAQYASSGGQHMDQFIDWR